MQDRMLDPANVLVDATTVHPIINRLLVERTGIALR